MRQSQRRQSTGLQLPHRAPGIRQAGGRERGKVRPRSEVRSRHGGTQGAGGQGASQDQGPGRQERRYRIHRRHPQRDVGHPGVRRRYLPHRRDPQGDLHRSRRPAQALCGYRAARQEQRLQHRPVPGPGARQPTPARPDSGGRRRGPEGIPRLAPAPGLRGAGRRQLPQALAGLLPGR